LGKSIISIVIPVYHAENLIDLSLTILDEYISNNSDFLYEVILVLDGPSDKTPILAKNWELSHDWIKVVELLQNQGKGAAVRKAISFVNGDYVFYMDVDLSTSLEAIQQGTKRLMAGADVVMGNRYLPQSIITYKPTVSRRFVTKVLQWMNRYFMHLPFCDTQCGFKGFRCDVFKHLMSDGVINRFMFDVELLVKGIRFGYKIEELPISWKYNSDSTIRIADLWRSTHELFRIYKRYLFWNTILTSNKNIN
jgi:glycosyltransferase involved in cell wall biosynthesis